MKETSHLPSHPHERRSGELSSPTDARQAPRLIPVTQWSQHHPWPTVPGLRWLIFNAHQNGFDAVVKRVGRRVLIDEAAFFAWVERLNTGDEG